jgi:hypothetical protein
MTYQYKLNPTPEQASTMEAWGELLRIGVNLKKIALED